MSANNSEIQEWVINYIRSSEGTDKLFDELDRLEQERAIKEHEVPLNMIPSKKCFEMLGFQFEKIAGDSFLCKAKFPNGWSARIKDKCHTSIVDENEIERAYYFYKATPSRNAYMILHSRFFIGVREAIENGIYTGMIVFIYDRQENKVIKEFEKCPNNWGKEYNNLREDAENYLDIIFPNWKDPVKYWNQAIKEE